MATKTVTNEVRFSTRLSSTRLVRAIEKASKKTARRLVTAKEYKDVKGSEVKNYADKFRR